MAFSTGSLPALRSRDYRLLFLGQLVSVTGSQMQHVALAWQLYLLTHSEWSLGLIGGFRVLPVLLFAVGGGVIADAVDRRRLMLLSQSLMALCSLTLALLSWRHQVTPAAIYALTAGNGLAFALDAPARHALVPLLVPREHLANALSLQSTMWQLAAVFGPALGGALVALVGATPVYLVDALSFLAVIGALLAMRHREVRARNGSRVSLGAAVEGLRFLRRSPVIMWTMAIDFGATFFAGALLLMPVFADKLLHLGSKGLAPLYAAQPAGAALAAIALSLRPPIQRQGRALLGAIVVYGAAIAVFGMSRWLPLSLLMMALSGAADTVSTVVRQTLRQMLTPDELRGRMASLNMIFFMGGPQLGEVEAGAVARLWGARVSVAGGGLVCVALALAAAAALPFLRRITLGDVQRTARA